MKNLRHIFASIWVRAKKAKAAFMGLDQDQGQTTYSQFGEDIISFIFLERKTSGFYVDIGAHDPFRKSNTAMLNQIGWTGINVEPDPVGFQRFEKHRPNDINLNIAVHNEESEVTLYRFRRGLSNTVLENRAKGIAKNKKALPSHIVPAMSMNAIMDAYLPKGQPIDFLNVDIEGYDQTALEAFDFDKYRPKLCCIECYRFDFLDPQAHPLVNLMISNDYGIVSINKMSFLFLDNRNRD
ncbi:hypothetical protein GCM10008927_15980 [Amylibacter ulvae]|uniref:Methyltransferase FkbM domain-containing protein n=1 Tax=Paramylibacter ulvae TaxID=1651968 RepID=A0ABQ3D0Z1_9RHOB|nr:FkbM family methyltransferase [Amylibacter ulvae]GHA51436.1 hypothetical protein GCM10008927_15980 [Amylibacter ulvae]